MRYCSFLIIISPDHTGRTWAAELMTTLAELESRDAAGEGETLPFLARPLPFCQRLMPLHVVLQHAPPSKPGSAA